MITNEPPSTVQIPPIYQNLDTVKRELVLMWNVSTDSENTTMTYNVILSTDSGFNDIIMNESLFNQTSLLLENLNLSSNTDMLLVGDYYWKVKAFDGAEWGAWSSTATLNVDAFNYTFDLNEGWNLNVFPLVLENLSDGSTFLYGGVDIMSLFSANSVLMYNSGQQTYQKVRYPWDPNFNLSIADGFFVNSPVDDAITVYGKPLISVEKNLSQGWNLLGWFDYFNDTSGSEIKAQFSANSVLVYDSEQQSYLKLRYPWDPDFNITFGDGFFVNLPENGLWYYTVQW